MGGPDGENSCFAYAAVDSEAMTAWARSRVTDQVTYDFDESPDTANHCLNSLTLSS